MLAAAFTCFAIFTGRTYFDIRPAGFSNLLVAVYLMVLVLATYRNILYIWLIVPIMVFWCNVHGGYLYVFIMLVPFIALHLLALFPRKWTITCFAIPVWLVLYLLTQKLFTDLNKVSLSLINEPFFTAQLVSKDPLFYLLVLLIVTAIALTIPRKVGFGVLYGFHIIALVLMFLAAFAKFFPAMPFGRMYSLWAKEQFQQCIDGSRLFFVLAFFGMTAVGLAVSFFKQNLVSLNFKSLLHTVFAGLVSFIAMIIFNPFHLTNLTHTFVIGISRHAEMWRQINEWHSAFEWSNPVGTSYPFLIMFLLGILALAFWLAALVLVPKSDKIPKGDLENQKKKFDFLLSSFGFIAAVFICWVTLISFSFIGYDLAGFIFVALFTAILLISVYKSIYLIYLFPLFVIFALWSSYPNFLKTPSWFKGINFHCYGRYIYPYILLPAYSVMSIIASCFSKKVKIRPLNIVYVFSAAFVSLILMIVIFNPFDFKWSAEGSGLVKFVKSLFYDGVTFKPAYTNNATPDYTYYFPALYVINLLSIDIWLAVPYLRSFLLQISADNTVPVQSESQSLPYQLPKTDLGLVVISALTIYMALKMRRFIPIAAIVACPIIAMFLDRTIRVVNASINFYRVKRFFVSAMPKVLQTFFILSVAGVTSFLAVSWGLKFKYIYLDPWPTDDKFTSVFMRMTASDAKPFYALKFIKDNKIQGKMFNYWTEGGFIAWGQQPDPNTGRTPLQLFMDGRAQAAYEPNAYNRWMDIMGARPVAEDAVRAGRTPDYREAGQWIDEQLTAENVWVALMPAGEFDSIFVKGLETSNNWVIIYEDNEQKIFIKKTAPDALRLFNGVMNGSTVYPTDFSRNLILSYYALSSSDPNARQLSLLYAMQALNGYPSLVSIQSVISTAARFPELRPSVARACKDYYDDFMANKAKYKKHNAYYDRIIAAMFAADHLGNLAKSAGDTELMNDYITKIKTLDSERLLLLESKKW
jgi:hypothetical protein